MEITGLEIRKTSVYSSKRLRSRLLFSTLGIDLVLDVGAITVPARDVPRPLYQGETLMPEICNEMDAIGFVLWDMEPAFRDPDTGRLLQIDGIFTRKSLNYVLRPAISHSEKTQP